jgi:1,4-alpha-glucan branching enzyme
MLDRDSVAALVAARHHDPFAVLGLHADADGRLRVAAMLPGATSVALHEAGRLEPLVQLEATDPAGLFEARIPRRRVRFDYRLAVSWIDGGTSLLADAYAYGPQLDDADLDRFAAGNHPAPWTLLGAEPQRIGDVNGTRFAVWAPNARRVSVVGSFNSWDGRRHPMRLRHRAGVWEIFVPHVAPGDLYKYEIVGADGTLLPLKADPYARAAELRPGTASRVAALPAPTPLPAERAVANRRDSPIAIYELHAGSWRRRADGGFLDWDELAAALPPYVAGLGFTHVELMPVAEHPFDGSWGYQCLGLYAPTARHGDLDGFRRFVAACHAAGLGVLVDWVPAHFPVDGHGLARFDGTALYEYADPREGWHPDWRSCIYNYGRHEVKNFLVGSARWWVECLGVDGLRVDAVASMLYRDYSRAAGQWVPNAHGGRENLEAIAFLREANTAIGSVHGAIMVAEESTAFPSVSAPVHAGGLGFHYKWNMGWMNDTLRYVHEDPVHRRWHHGLATFGLLYAYSENFILPLSHDEVVHGKGSLLGRMPGDDWQRHANLRAYYGYMWGHPGKKLLFMGQEFAQPHEWRHDEALPWHLLDDPRHAGIAALVRDLNGLYRAEPALHRLDCEPAGFEWLIADDADQSVFAWLRRDGAGRHAIVVVNFTPVPRHHYALPLPDDAPARWREALNTDSRHYGGGDLGNRGAVIAAHDVPTHGRNRGLSLTVPPLAAVFLVAA